MGRTNPTFRDRLAALQDRWKRYRRGLRHENQPRFDRLWNYATKHADSGGLLNHETPILPVLMGMNVEQERRLDELEAEVEALRTRLAEIEAAHPQVEETEEAEHTIDHGQFPFSESPDAQD